MTTSARFLSIGFCVLAACVEVVPDDDVTILEESSTTSPIPVTSYFAYTIKPSQTDGGHVCADRPPEHDAIGCEGLFAGEAPNAEHYLYVPVATPQSGKLFVFFGGAGSVPAKSTAIMHAAALRGYHVIGLSYENDLLNYCGHDTACYGKFLREVLTGEDCGLTCDEKSHIDLHFEQHPQDTIVNRLVRVITWAKYAHPDHGWERYVPASGTIDWSHITIGGFSNGSSYAAFTGLEHLEIGRVVLLGGPNDGAMVAEPNGNGEVWKPADYLARAPGSDRYFGLVHEHNKGEYPDMKAGFEQVRASWTALGMLDGTEFDPEPDSLETFGSLHALYSTDEMVATLGGQAHITVHNNEYSTEECETVRDDVERARFGCKIGYDGAWRHLLGSGKD